MLRSRVFHRSPAANWLPRAAENNLNSINGYALSLYLSLLVQITSQVASTRSKDEPRRNKGRKSLFLSLKILFKQEIISVRNSVLKQSLSIFFFRRTFEERASAYRNTG